MTTDADKLSMAELGYHDLLTECGRLKRALQAIAGLQHPTGASPDYHFVLARDIAAGTLAREAPDE